MCLSGSDSIADSILNLLGLILGKIQPVGVFRERSEIGNRSVLPFLLFLGRRCYILYRGAFFRGAKGSVVFLLLYRSVNLLGKNMFLEKTKQSLFRGSLLCAIGVLSASNVVIAAEDEQMEEVVVTGSYIKRSSENSPSPLSVITSADIEDCLLYTSPSPRDATLSRMPSSA